MKCRRCKAEIEIVNGIRVEAEHIHVKPIYGWSPLLGDPNAVTVHIPDKRAVFGCLAKPGIDGAIKVQKQHYCPPIEI